jgi:hypothetical protein
MIAYLDKIPFLIYEWIVGTRVCLTKSFILGDTTDADLYSRYFSVVEIALLLNS